MFCWYFCLGNTKILYSTKFCAFRFLLNFQEFFFIIRGVRASVRKSLKWLKRCAFQCIKVWKWSFVKRKKVWNQIKIWTLTSLYYMELILVYVADIRHTSHYFTRKTHSVALTRQIYVKVRLEQIHWASKETYHFFRATLTKIHCIKINHI